MGVSRHPQLLINQQPGPHLPSSRRRSSLRATRSQDARIGCDAPRDSLKQFIDQRSHWAQFASLPWLSLLRMTSCDWPSLSKLHPCPPIFSTDPVDPKSISWRPSETCVPRPKCQNAEKFGKHNRSPAAPSLYISLVRDRRQVLKHEAGTGNACLVCTGRKTSPQSLDVLSPVIDNTTNETLADAQRPLHVRCLFAGRTPG